MRISDWSSDLCSSDLLVERGDIRTAREQFACPSDHDHPDMNVCLRVLDSLGKCEAYTGTERVDRRIGKNDLENVVMKLGFDHWLVSLEGMVCRCNALRGRSWWDILGTGFRRLLMDSEKVRLQILCLGRGLLFGEPIMGCSVSSCRHRDRKSVVEGKRVLVRVDSGGRRNFKKKKIK